MQLQSDEQFVIVRQLDNPADTNTYYVRAYIRKSLDDTLIATVNLTDKGSQRFTKAWQVVADTSGEGMYIDIETRIFTDSGYTTESDVYGRQSQTYLVAKRYNPVYGGGGTGVDYKKVRQIIKEELEKLPKIDIPEVKEVDFEPVLRAIDSIEIPPYPEPEKVELGGIIRLIERVRMAIEGLPKPKEPEKVDFSGIYKGLEELSKLVKNETGTSQKNIEEKFKSGLDKIMEEMKKYTFVMARVEVPEKPKNEKPWRKNYFAPVRMD